MVCRQSHASTYNSCVWRVNGWVLLTSFLREALNFPGQQSPRILRISGDESLVGTTLGWLGWFEYFRLLGSVSLGGEKVRRRLSYRVNHIIIIIIISIIDHLPPLHSTLD